MFSKTYLLKFAVMAFLLLLVLTLCHHKVIAQDLPTISWAQGDLSGLKWGMTKTEVERIINVRLDLWSTVGGVTHYDTKARLTWINDTRISFNCEWIDPGICFYHDRLFKIWFCMHSDPKRILSEYYGQGIPNEYYPSDEEQRIWWDANTKMHVDYSHGEGGVSLRNWRISDRAYDRNSSNEYEDYLFIWKNRND